VTYEYRRILNGVYGQLSAQVLSSATSIVDASFSTLPVITGTAEYIPLSFSALNGSQKPEVFWVTAHASGSSTVTVVRAKEGTTATTWPSGTQWSQSTTIRDSLFDTTSGAVPSDLHIGGMFVERDTAATKIKTYTAGNFPIAGTALPSAIGPNRAGNFPSAQDTIMVRGAKTNLTTNSVGDGFVSFRQPFPNACITVVAVSADNTAFVGTCTVWSEGTTGFDFRAALGAVSQVNAAIHIHYFALGW
jgi:hypothetical protein